MSKFSLKNLSPFHPKPSLDNQTGCNRDKDGITPASAIFTSKLRNAKLDTLPTLLDLKHPKITVKVTDTVKLALVYILRFWLDDEFSINKISTASRKKMGKGFGNSVVTAALNILYANGILRKIQGKSTRYDWVSEQHRFKEYEERNG